MNKRDTFPCSATFKPLLLSPSRLTTQSNDRHRLRTVPAPFDTLGPLDVCVYFSLVFCCFKWIFCLFCVVGCFVRSCLFFGWCLLFCSWERVRWCCYLPFRYYCYNTAWWWSVCSRLVGMSCTFLEFSWTFCSMYCVISLCLDWFLCECSVLVYNGHFNAHFLW